MNRVARPRRRENFISPLLQTFIVVAGILQIPFAAWAFLDASGRGALVWVGTACLLAIGFPMAARGRRLNPFEPIVWCMIAVLLGTTLETFYLAFSSHYRVDYLMFGQGYWDIVYRGFWVVASLVCVSLGYLATNAKFNLEAPSYFFRRKFTADGRFYLACGVSIIISLITVYIVVRQFDITLDTISKKRHLEVVNSNGDTVYASLGYLRMLNQLTETALYYFLAIKFIRKERFGIFDYLFPLGLFFVVSILPFISSSRSEIAITVLGCLAVAYLAGRVRLRYAVLGGVFIATAAYVMENLRETWRTTGASNTIIDTIIGSGDFFNLSKITAIMHAVPDRVSLLHGQSYLALFTAPIPRSMWPDKPLISLDPWVKSTVLGLKTYGGENGSPPTVVGEAFLNFVPLGALTVCFLAGLLMRFIYNCFEPFLGRKIGPTVLYASIFLSIGMQLMSLSFTRALVMTLNSTIIVLLFFMMAGTRAFLVRRVVPRAPVRATAHASR